MKDSESVDHDRNGAVPPGPFAKVQPHAGHVRLVVGGAEFVALIGYGIAAVDPCGLQ
jgi:hypothetical protein